MSESTPIVTRTLRLRVKDKHAKMLCAQAREVKNVSNRQVNELLMNPKAKPEWLKAIELKAMKACISLDSKLST